MYEYKYDSICNLNFRIVTLKDHEMVITGYGIYQNIVLTFILRFSLEFTST